MRWKPPTAALRSALVLALVLGTQVAATPASAPRPASGAATQPASPNPAPTAAKAAAAAALADNSGHLYVLDGWGGLHPGQGSPGLSYSGYWPGWDIARGFALFPAGDGGYSVDGWGGLHPIGDAPQVQPSAYWTGWDIARGIVLAPWADATHPAGWVLDGWGATHPFGNAPALPWSAYWPGWDIARGLVILPDSQPTSVGGYVLDGWGGLHPLGNAPPVSWSAYWGGWDIARAISVLPAATHAAPGGYVLDGWGGLHQFGAAPATHWSAYWGGWDIARSLTAWSAAPAGSPGGWVLDGWGGLHPFGSAAAVGWSAYWPGWDIARSMSGSGTGAGARGPTARVLAVPMYRQIHPLDCEAAALQMAMAYRGIGVSQDAILSALPNDPRHGYWDANGRLHWGDPYAAFVGVVDGSEPALSGYGVFYPPLSAAAGRFGAQVMRAGEGIPVADVYSAILNGHVVVAWVTTDWSYHGVVWYTAFDGHPAMYTAQEHAVTIVGVNESSVLVNNPLYGQQWVSKSTFESAFATFDNMALMVF